MIQKLKAPILLLLGIVLIVASGCIGKKEADARNPYNLDLVMSVEAYEQQVAADPRMQMVNLEQAIPGIGMDIRYATANNFTKSVIYTAPKAFARKPVAEALNRVQDSLAHYRLGMKIYDAYRPYAASLRFYEVYPDTNFVANPRYGSRHNRGCAIDLTLIELSSGKEIPMPTEFDDFSAKAHPDYAELPDTVLANRKFLFDMMAHFGFTHYPSEWWHFDYFGWEQYKLMDLSFEELTRFSGFE
jgi:D-alanyl-D-alanine dipeptidase